MIARQGTYIIYNHFGLHESFSWLNSHARKTHAIVQYVGKLDETADHGEKRVPSWTDFRTDIAWTQQVLTAMLVDITYATDSAITEKVSK